MDNTNPTKKQQVHDLINTLRERSHAVEFAEKCAKRADSYASGYAYASTYAAAADSAHARYTTAADSAFYAAHAADSAADSAFYAARSAYTSHSARYAADASDYAVYADSAGHTTYAASAAERDIQITHLKELHVREESCLNVKKSMDVGKGEW